MVVLILVWCFGMGYSCKVAKRVIDCCKKEARAGDPPIMTNRELTDSLVKVSNELNEIKKTMLMPDPSIFEMRNGLLVFKSKIYIDSLQAGYILVGTVRDTSFHVDLPLDTLKPKK